MWNHIPEDIRQIRQGFPIKMRAVCLEVVLPSPLVPMGLWGQAWSAIPQAANKERWSLPSFSMASISRCCISSTFNCWMERKCTTQWDSAFLISAVQWASASVIIKVQLASVSLMIEVQLASASLIWVVQWTSTSLMVAPQWAFASLMA